MSQRVATFGQDSVRDPRHPPALVWWKVGRNDPAAGRLPALVAALLSLLAPTSLRAQDPITVQARASVMLAQPSQEALRSALRLARQHPEVGDSVPAPRPQLAQIRVQRPESPGKSAILVSIEFLHN